MSLGTVLLCDYCNERIWLNYNKKPEDFADGPYMHIHDSCRAK